jgi:aminobenzoyl-glutamate transport protein
VHDITPEEKKGLKWAGIWLFIFAVALAFTIIPENGLFRNPETGTILHSPFFDGIITGILVFFFVPGLAYGIVTKSIRNDTDMMKHIIKSMGTMATYIVLVFFAAQFVYFFRYSNLGLILAIDGAEFLKSIGFTGITLIVAFVLLSAFINMFMGSASAKWAIMAPVFVPMFMLLDYHPALTQAAFRIGDSVTNLITPMMSYFALIVAFAQKYDEKYGIGTIISTMIPYTVILTIFWIIILVIWMLLGLPLGPDGPLYLVK